MALQSSENETISNADSLLAKLRELHAAEEEAARHLFVVCGQPAHQYDFIMLWRKEDPEWFDYWWLLGMAISKNK